MANLLELTEVDAGYGESQVLWSINLQLEKKELTLILGSNGAGKTTLLRVISGLLEPWKGQVKFMDADITKTPAHKRVEIGIAMVPEGKQLWPLMTVYQTLELGSYSKRARDKFDENIDLVYQLFPVLKERRNQLAGSLSGGEAQMLAIARALMTCPKLLLMDEPTFGLAPKISYELLQKIKELIAHVDLTVLLVEQNVRMSMPVADKVCLIELGKIVLTGKKEEVENNPSIKSAYLGM